MLLVTNSSLYITESIPHTIVDLLPNIYFLQVCVGGGAFKRSYWLYWTSPENTTFFHCFLVQVTFSFVHSTHTFSFHEHQSKQRIFILDWNTKLIDLLGTCQILPAVKIKFNFKTHFIFCGLTKKSIIAWSGQFGWHS